MGYEGKIRSDCRRSQPTKPAKRLLHEAPGFGPDWGALWPLFGEFSESGVGPRVHRWCRASLRHRAARAGLQGRDEALSLGPRVMPRCQGYSKERDRVARGLRRRWTETDC